jgi:hypothetical protein
VSQQGLDFSKEISKKKNVFFYLTYADVQMGIQKVPKSDYQSLLFMSKIIGIFLKNIS